MKNAKGHRLKGMIFIEAGILLLIAALALTYYNFWEASKADKASNHLVEMIHQEMPDDSSVSYDYDPYGQTETEEEKTMPTLEIEGNLYIGTLTIPQLGLELPVVADWDYDKLKLSPCRYSGSYYTDDLVIAGHNYARHFSRIKWIDLNEGIYFTNVENESFHYIVNEVETLKPTQIEEMTTGEWDLTLFTCTTGGQSRCAVRCKKAEEQQKER